MLHYPQSRSKHRHSHFDFIEEIVLTLEVLVEVRLPLKERLDFLVPTDPYCILFELCLHGVGYLFGEGQAREVGADDVAFYVDLDRSGFLLEEEEGVVVGMEVELHLLA